MSMQCVFFFQLMLPCINQHTNTTPRTLDLTNMTPVIWWTQVWPQMGWGTMCRVSWFRYRHLVGQPDQYLQHPSHHDLLQNGRFNMGYSELDWIQTHAVCWKHILISIYCILFMFNIWLFIVFLEEKYFLK